MTAKLRNLLLTLLSVLILTAAAAWAEDVYTSDMLDRALLSTGNTERLHRVIEKARSGAPVSIVYLGGSITEGEGSHPKATKCYAYLSAQKFAERFMVERSQLKYFNMGIGGTPSVLGLARCEQDVLSHQPDIVFVEYAVNDGVDAINAMYYESTGVPVRSDRGRTSAAVLTTKSPPGKNPGGRKCKQE